MKEVSALLIRHAKTQGNMEKRYIGSKTDEELCPEGIEELMDSGIKDQNIRFANKVYVSPMKRCIQTARLLFGDVKQLASNDLMEIDFGDFENMNYQELNGNKDYQSWIDSGGTIAFPGGESREDFCQRNIAAFKEILLSEINEEDTIPFVIHGGSIMAIMSGLTGEDYFSFQIKPGEAYAIKCQVSEGKIDVISYNRIFIRNHS